MLVPACTYGTYGTAVVPLANLIVGLHPLPPQTRPQAIPSARSEDTSADVDLIASEQFASTASGSTRREPQYSTCSRRAAFASIASAQPPNAYQGFKFDCSWSYPKQGAQTTCAAAIWISVAGECCGPRAASLAVRGQPLRIRGCYLNPAGRRAGGILSGEFLRRRKRSVYRRIAAVVDAR